MSKKILSILLAISMMLTILAACNNDPVDNVENPDDQQTEQTDPNENQGGEETVLPETLNLVVDGTSEYVIVRGENAYISEITASTELQNYVKQITGVEIPIVTDSTEPAEKEIVVGKTNRESESEFDRDKLGDDGLVIKTNGKKLYLVGGEKRGTLYAVYEFLEAYLGCRFYSSDFEVIPETKTISLEKIEEDKQIPAFDTRETLWIDYDGNFSFKVKRKVNGKKWGQIPEELGGSNTWAGSPAHTMEPLCGVPQNEQPCLTDENVYQTALTNLRAWLESNPGARYVSVSMNDNHNLCYCDNCSALMDKYGSYAGVNLTFVNRLAEEIKDEYPNVLIHTFAYFENRIVPTGIEPADNVMVELCSIEQCFSHPLEECTAYSGESFVDLLKGWAAISDTLAIWDYTTNYAHFASTFPNFEVLRKNLKLFADNNVEYMFEQGNHCDRSLEFGELRGYLISKLMWNPYMSQEELDGYMVEFCKDYYGPGWESIVKYINLAEEESNENCFGIYRSPDEMFNWPEATDFNPKDSYPEELTVDMINNYESVDWTKYWNWFRGYAEEPKILTEGDKLFQEAIAAAETEEQKIHLNKSYTQIQYIRSYYLGLNLEFGSSTIGKIVGYFTMDHPDDFTADEVGPIRRNIIKFAREQVYEEYIAYNRALAEKIMSYGVYMIKENKGLSLDLDFSQLPEDWYD